MKALFCYLAILGTGLLFGFFFTMSVSIMPGLDATDPYAALIANQDIGRATQQSLFFVALLGTPLALIITIVMTWKIPLTRNWCVLAMLSYLVMMGVTIFLNVPLNQQLDVLAISPGMENAPEHWLAYSVDWQMWNWLRVLFSGLSLLFAAFALRNLPQ